MAKYKNKKVEFDGYVFDSKLECDYYKALKYGNYSFFYKQIDLQPVYVLQEAFKKNGRTIKAITYKADFFLIRNDGTQVVIDIKGMSTETAKIKRKMFLYKYPELQLDWVSFSKMDGGWIDYFELKKARKARKKAKEAKKND